MSVNYEKESPPLVYEFLGYLQVERGFSSQTVYNYFIDLRLFFRFTQCKRTETPFSDFHLVDIHCLGLDYMKSIHRQDISAFLTWLALEKSAKERTRNRKIAVLKSYFRFLVDLEYLEKNIMSQISSSKAGKSLPKYLEEESMVQLLQAVTDEFWLRDTAIIMLMMSAGLRVSEVFSLNVNSIQNDSLSVVGKGKKERQVYLSQRTVEAIQDYLDVRPNVGIDALFLSNRKTRFTIRGIQKMVTKYFERIGKEGYSCHKLRHTAATQMMKSGANIREIQEILGHESISTTEIYTHVSNEDLRRVAQNLEF